MKDFITDVKEIYGKDRGLFYMMLATAIIAVVLLVYAVFSLSPGASVVKVGYGDIGRYQGGAWSSMANSGGYHDGAWWNILAFPLLFIVFGFLHNAIAAKLYKKKGAGVARMFVVMTICLVLATFVVLLRLLADR